VLMLGSDYQKYAALKIKPGILTIIQDWFQMDSSKIPEIPTTLDKSWFIALSFCVQAIYWGSLSSMDWAASSLLLTFTLKIRPLFLWRMAGNNTNNNLIFFYPNCFQQDYLISLFIL
jgi:hypothetical protein